MKAEKEIWKKLKQDKNYLISNNGKIYSLKTNKILKPFINNKGYQRIMLSNGKRYLVHRLVAEVFLPKKNIKKAPNEKNIDLKKITINHIDNNKINNQIKNLEWCTNKYNNLLKKNKNGIKCKKILQFDKNGHFIRKWEDINEILNEMGFKYNSNIYKCIIGKSKTAYGYIWKYE